MKKILKTFKILSFIIIPPLIVFIYFFGWGWLVPYELQPSYWQFRNMCKLNELPNNEEKYNKILSYFDTDLDILDWEELNGRKWKVTKEHGFYRQGIYEYATTNKGKQLNSRTSIIAAFLSNKSEINQYNINQMSIGGSWHTRRYYFEIANLTRHDDMWIEKTLACVDVAKEKLYTASKEKL